MPDGNWRAVNVMELVEQGSAICMRVPLLQHLGGECRMEDVQHCFDNGLCAACQRGKADMSYLARCGAALLGTYYYPQHTVLLHTVYPQYAMLLVLVTQRCL